MKLSKGFSVFRIDRCMSFAYPKRSTSLRVRKDNFVILSQLASEKYLRCSHWHFQQLKVDANHLKPYGRKYNLDSNQNHGRKNERPIGPAQWFIERYRSTRDAAEEFLYFRKYNNVIGNTSKSSPFNYNNLDDSDWSLCAFVWETNKQTLILWIMISFSCRSQRGHSQTHIPPTANVIQFGSVKWARRHDETNKKIVPTRCCELLLLTCVIPCTSRLHLWRSSARLIAFVSSARERVCVASQLATVENRLASRRHSQRCVDAIPLILLC